MEFISRHKKLFLSLGMVICVTAIIFTLNPSFRPTFVEKALAYTVVPVQEGFTAAVRWIGDKFNGFADTNRLVDENEALMEEISRLRIRKDELQDIIARCESEKKTVDPKAIVALFKDTVTSWSTENIPQIIRQHVSKIYAHKDGGFTVNVGVHMEYCGGRI